MALAGAADDQKRVAETTTEEEKQTVNRNCSANVVFFILYVILIPSERARGSPRPPIYRPYIYLKYITITIYFYFQLTNRASIKRVYNKASILYYITISDILFISRYRDKDSAQL